MAVDPQTSQHLIELVYDVLPDGEEETLRRRIESEPEVAEAYRQAETAAARLASAARLEGWKIELKRPDTFIPAARTTLARPLRQKPLPRAPVPMRRYWGRETSWVVGIGSALLLAFALGGYFYHRGQLADIATDHLRLRVVGPSQLHHGIAAQFAMTTTSVTGRPLSAPVELAIYSLTGEQLMVHKERTDGNGQLQVTLPADLRLPDEIRLEIVAVHDDKQERIDTRWAVLPMQCRVHLTLDALRYRQGDLVRWRLLSAAIPERPAAGELAIEFEIVDGDGTAVPGSASRGTTRHGVAVGEFLVPSDGKAGDYGVVARSLDRAFPDQRLGFTVAGDGEERATARPGPTEGDPLDIRFYPEAGALAAGLENRVYFSARDRQGQPAKVLGTVVDHEGHPVAAVETEFAGRGVFSFEPQAGENYHLNIASPEGIQEQPKLPAVTNAPLTLTTGLSIFEAKRPIQFNVRSREAGIPLVATATWRGMAVGQQALVTKEAANSVEIALDDRVAGVVCLSLYDYRTSPPQPIAQRLVYRRPAQGLEVRLQSPAEPATAGGTIRLPLQVVDEQGQPAEAALSVAVVTREAAPAMTADSSPEAWFLLGAEFDDLADVDNADYYLSEDRKAAIALDRLLGTRRSVETGLKRPAPPTVFDNLNDLEDRYRESLESYRANRTRPQNALTMLSLFGGIGLLLFVAMLAILNIPTGLRLWAPSLAAALACVVIGAILMDPERLKTLPGNAVAFVSLRAVPVPPVSRAEAAPVVGESAFEFPAQAGVRGSTLSWQPLLLTDAQGRASIEFTLPETVTAFRVLVHAHTVDGRFGSADQEISLDSADTPAVVTEPKR